MINHRNLAIYMAGRFHKDQMYGESLYCTHLEDVDRVLADAGYAEGAVVRIAAWLHDALEDTDATRECLERLFGMMVADTVWRVTDEPGANRAARHAATYPKIAVCERAIAVKLADRIANLEHSSGSTARFALMYCNEDEEFVSALRKTTPSDPGVAALWQRYSNVIWKVRQVYSEVRP